MITMDDKYRFEDFGFEPEPGHEDPITPNFTRKTLSIPGMAGEWDFGADIGPRSFSYPLRIDERVYPVMQEKFNRFIEFWVDHFGQPREVKMVRDYEQDKFYMVKLATQIIPERLPDEGSFVLQLVANYPYKKFLLSSDKIILDSELPIMSDIRLDTGLSNRQITKPQTFKIINNGTIAIPLTLLIEGSGTNVSFSANGKTLTLGTFTNKTIEIADRYIVKVNGVTDLSFTNGIFPILLPGKNVITVGGSNLNLTASESLTYQYV